MPPDQPEVRSLTFDKYLRSPWITPSMGGKGELTADEAARISLSAVPPVVYTPNTLLLESPARYEPRTSCPRHVVIFGGLGLSSVALFSPLARALSEAGYSVEIQDLPGSGSCHARMQRVSAAMIESFMRDQLVRIIAERPGGVHVVAFSTSALVLIKVVSDLPLEVRRGIRRLAYISVPLGIRGWGKAMLGRLVSGLEQGGMAGQTLVRAWDFVWINLEPRRYRSDDSRVRLPQLAWYPGRAIASIVPYQSFASSCRTWSAGIPLLVVGGGRDGKCPWDVVERTAYGLADVPTVRCFFDSGHAVPVGRQSSQFIDLMMRWVVEEEGG